MPIKPHKTISKAINNSNFGLSWHPVFAHNPKRLAKIEFERSKELFERIYTNDTIGLDHFLFSTYDELSHDIIYIESEYRKELEKIAVDTIREIYDVPDELCIKPKLLDSEAGEEIELDNEEQKDLIDKFETLPEEQAIKIMTEVRKRIILNAICNGSSVLIWKSAHYIAKDKIDKINPDLFELYNRYIAIVNIILWRQDLDALKEFDMDEANQQGQCSIDENNDLHAEAVNMPVLLMETNKVVIDYLILHGVPQTFSADELDMYYALADKYEDEIWHNLLSPTLYSDLLEVLDTNPVNLPKIIMKLCKMSPQELEKLFIFVQFDKVKAKNIIKLL